MTGGGGPPLARMQRGLEALYRLEAGVEIGDFVVGEAVRDRLEPRRRPREQLFALPVSGEETQLALFVDPAALANLEARDPSHRLDDTNLGDFLLALEGVSHFVYVCCCARTGRPVSQLELELQAEVDKYVACLLTRSPEPAVSASLRRRLFGDVEYEPDLDHDEHARYRAANDNAHRYAAWLEATFVAPRRIPEMLAELRRFYREGLASKLATIARAA
ncbi:MAG TPA: hypothetical protein VNO30_12540 [Kofleriaceae bacterium]|nr:hypothetical protein [Kofleriaceae bacterium]